MTDTMSGAGPDLDQADGSLCTEGLGRCGSGTGLVDVASDLILPGFQDAHVRSDSGRHPDPADPRRGRVRSARVPRRPRRPRHLGPHADRLLEHLLPAITFEEPLDRLRVAEEHLVSPAARSWQDAEVGPMSGQADTPPNCLHAARGSDRIDVLVDRRGGGGASRLRAMTIKPVLDGIAENVAAAMLEPREDGCGGAIENSGLDPSAPSGCPEHAPRLGALGFQVHRHALGDRTVHTALEGAEEIREATALAGGLHHRAHRQVVPPDDLRHFARVGVTAALAVGSDRPVSSTDLEVLDRGPRAGRSMDIASATVVQICVEGRRVHLRGQ